MSNAQLAPAVVTLLDLLVELAFANVERGADAEQHQGEPLADVPGGDP